MEWQSLYWNGALKTYIVSYLFCRKEKISWKLGTNFMLISDNIYIIDETQYIKTMDSLDKYVCVNQVRLT